MVATVCWLLTLSLKSYGEEPRTPNGGRTVSSTNAVGKAGETHVETWDWIPTSHHSQKLTQDGLKSKV